MKQILLLLYAFINEDDSSIELLMKRKSISEIHIKFNDYKYMETHPALRHDQDPNCLTFLLDS